MTDHELDQVIRRILVDVQKADEEQASGEAIPFYPSVRYQHNMRAMSKNPKKWLRNRERPVWKNVLQRVAMILLAVSIGFGGLMAGVPSARAAVIRWVTEWYETHIVYRHSGDDVSSELNEYEITALPDGFSEVDRIEISNIISVTYADEEGNVICFDYCYMHQGAAIVFDTESTIVSEITDMPGQFFETMEPGEFNTITWIDEQNNIQFSISGCFNKEELLHMAISVR